MSARMLCPRRIAIAAFLVLAIVAEATAPWTPEILGVRSAQAIIGRPLTPLSYAGVARRTTRRAVAVGAATAAAAPVVVTPGCVQAVDAYGRLYYRCP